MCQLGKSVMRSGLPAERRAGIDGVTGVGSSGRDPRTMTTVGGAGTGGMVIQATVITVDATAIPVIMATISEGILRSASMGFTEKTAGRCG